MRKQELNPPKSFTQYNDDDNIEKKNQINKQRVCVKDRYIL